ncbi:F-box domain-containing protein [Mycena sanguinolenta]|uniref:F-box domain-containing protein n=1 Tax=Mycena sanguinolenta TaxID=230812 RepID=A0A8H6YUS2_9AGAR|nr:F-box domain-containing protein [Mycena sanguinolenta]
MSASTLSDELVLGICECLTDADLLSLATVSKHIHDIALMTHLGRHGITETDIQAGSFQCTSGAVCALRTARFITKIEALTIQFQSRARLGWDIAALAGLARRVPPIKSVDLEWGPLVGIDLRARKSALAHLFLDLVSHRSQPAIIVCPKRISVVRPQQPIRRRLLARLRVRGPRYESEPNIEKAELLQAFPTPPLKAALRMSIRVFPGSGSLVVLFPEVTEYMHFPLDIRPAEVTLLLLHSNLPVVKVCSMDDTCAISDPALHPFICRHQTLRWLYLGGDPADETMETDPILPLPSGSLPQLEGIHGSAYLLSWVLASLQNSPNLVYATIQLYLRPGTRDYYRTALCGLALRPTTRWLTCQFTGWAPWNTPDFAAPNAPERTLSHVTDLYLEFRVPSKLPQAAVLIEWLQLFDGLHQVAFYQVSSSSSKKLRIVLQKKFPNITFSMHTYPLR